MNKQIADFLQKQTTASVCCVDEFNLPYCFSIFYGFDAEEGLLYFKSSSSARHSSLLRDHPQVAGTILPDHLNKLAIKGIQFNGTILPPSLAGQAAETYHRRFPFALAIPGELWTIRLEAIKMTDNKMGFGKKISWNREVSIQDLSENQ